MNDRLSVKPRYNLNVVVQETGLKADTLRAWERRYDLPHPSRSDGGHRLYSELDIETIKWLQSRMDEGMRISQAVEYWQDLVASGRDPLQPASLNDHPGAVPAGQELVGQTLPDLRNRWVQHIQHFDEPGAEQVLNQAFAQFPIEVVCRDLLYPAMTEIGAFWFEGSGTVQQEHFASELATRKIQALISAAPNPLHDQKVLLACPAGETHTISLLVVNLLLRYRGWDVIYLGSDVPLRQLTETVMEFHPDLAVLSASRLPAAAELVKVVQMLRSHHIPSAYGGWIFTRIETLVSRIPAHYLGTDFHGAVAIIENLLAYPKVSAVPDLPLDQEIIEDYQDKLKLLEYKTLEHLHTATWDPAQDQGIREANYYLSTDIVAGLIFGDLGLIKFDLEWIRSLLAHRDLSGERFGRYLAAYAAAAGEVLGPGPHPIVSWMESIQADQPGRSS
jgi:methanogenic corrinoid protein MtbC1